MTTHRNRLEPEAIDIHPLSPDAALLSIAVSLKRIADGFDLPMTTPQLLSAEVTAQAPVGSKVTPKPRARKVERKR